MARITTADEAMTPSLMTWRSVFAGAVIGLALTVLLGSLWFALAYGSDYDAIRTNFNWYVGATGIFAMFVAGFFAAYLSGVRGARSGFLHGMTVWGLLVVAGMIVLPLMAGLPQFATTPTDVQAAASGFDSGTVWTTFWSLLIGFGAALTGGLIGGAITRPASVVTTETVRMQRAA